MALTGLRAALIGATPRVVERLPPGVDSLDPTGSYRLGMEVVRWRGIGRDLMADVLPAVAVGAVMVLGSGPAARGEAPPRRPLDLLAWALMGVAAAVLLGRRRWPLGVLAVATAASVVYLVLEYPHGPILLALSVAMYSVAVRLPLVPSLAACGVTMLAVVVPDMLVLDPGRLPVEAPVTYSAMTRVSRSACTRPPRSTLQTQRRLSAPSPPLSRPDTLNRIRKQTSSVAVQAMRRALDDGLSE